MFKCTFTLDKWMEYIFIKLKYEDHHIFQKFIIKLTWHLLETYFYNLKIENQCPLIKKNLILDHLIKKIKFLTILCLK